MMINKNTLVCFVLMALLSCQKEPDASPDPPAPTDPVVPPTAKCKPVKAYLYDDYAGTTLEDSIRYEYSGTLLTKLYLNTNAYFSFEYANGKVSRRNYCDLSSNTCYNYKKFSYNSNGTLSKVQEFTDLGGPTLKTDSLAFIYSNGKLVTLKQYRNPSPSLELTEELIYTYTGNNITSQRENVHSMGTVTTNITNFSYDNKSNYFIKQQDQFFTMDPLFVDSDIIYYAWVFSENNITREEYAGSPGSFIEWGYVADAKGNLAEVKLGGHTYIKYSYQCP